MTTELSLDEILRSLGGQLIDVLGDRGRSVTHPAPITDARDVSAITFCNRTGEAAQRMIAATGAGVVICDDTAPPYGWSGAPTLVRVREPRLAFLRVVAEFFTRRPAVGVHPTAVVDAAAHVHAGASIGAFAVVGACEIGDGSRVGSHVHLADGTRVGRNVNIFPGTVVGADGFGYQRNETGEFEKFPHVGGVLIEDDVEIGANVCIDRGTLGDTIIRAGAKIDNFVHIAHNVVVGRHTAVIAHAMIGGSTRIGDYAWVAPCACVRDGLTVGDRAVIGLGAVVVKDVAAGETVMGAPAREAAEYKRLLQRLRSLPQG
jgi:UDP-3-O-[3-hydroxymyristoyl] glucosamine N-acyltransferase